MKTLKRIFLIIPALFLLLTCAKDEDPEKFILSVSVTPLDGGSVSPDGGVFQEGTVVTLRATPANGYLFREWAGDLQNTDNPIIVTMGADMNVTVVFVKSDGDNDGVTDDIDACPGTPPGEAVDATGCSASETDTDGDGVIDDLDNCPDTPEGEEVNEQGCIVTSAIYLDSNGITIKCYEWGPVGHVGEVNGVTYTIVDEEMLREMIENNEDVTTVCTTKVLNMSELFLDTTFNGNISSWDVSNVTDMTFMFSYSSFNQDISAWDVSNVTSMKGMFHSIDLWVNLDPNPFNQDISSWDVSNVEDMSYMFFHSSFNQDLSGWNVANVTQCMNFSTVTPQWVLPKPNFTNCDPN